MKIHDCQAVVISSVSVMTVRTMDYAGKFFGLNEIQGPIFSIGSQLKLLSEPFLFVSYIHVCLQNV